MPTPHSAPPPKCLKRKHQVYTNNASTTGKYWHAHTYYTSLYNDLGYLYVEHYLAKIIDPHQVVVYLHHRAISLPRT